MVLYMNLKKSLPKLHKQVICEMEERMRVRKKEKKNLIFDLCLFIYLVVLSLNGHTWHLGS